jgi:Ca-activated chloride channel homolog
MRAMLVQWSPEDRIRALSFSGGVTSSLSGTGLPADQDRLKQWGAGLRADGGTDMYACALEALRSMMPDLAGGTYLPAIVIMTDGRSEGNRDAFIRSWRAQGSKVPVFGITFGDADRTQLDSLTAETGGRVFDGRSGLVDAFRAVRGYN